MLDEMLHQEICHIFGMNIYIFPLVNALLIVKIGRLGYSLGKKVQVLLYSQKYDKFTTGSSHQA